MSINHPAKTILLTGGRAPVTLELARLFHQAGHRIIIAESIPIHLCSYSRAVERNYLVPPPRTDAEAYISRLEEIVFIEKVDILIPTCEEIFTIAQYLNRLSAKCLVWTEPIEKLDLLHNKWMFIQSAQELGIPVPKTWKVESEAEITQALRSMPEPFPVILKPVYSRFASRVMFLSHSEESLPSISVSRDEPWIVQQWIAGKQICSYSVAYRGEVIAHSAYRTTFTAGRGSSIAFQPVQHDRLFLLVQRWIKEWNYTGQFALDWIETAEGEIYPIECNPRTTSGVHLFTLANRLDQIFAHPDSSALISPKPNVRRMLTLAMWSYGLKSVRSIRQFWDWLITCSSSQDVVFRWNDPLPFFTQFHLLFYFSKVSRTVGISMLEASTHDIEWNGGRL